MRRLVITVMAAGLAAATPVGAQGQGQSLDARMTQVEKRLNTVERVLSRQNGGGPLVQPEIGPPDATGGPAAGTPATAPLADFQARLAAVEGATASLTNRVETAEHRLQLLESDFAAYRKETDARLKALEDGRAAGPASAAASLPDEKPVLTKPNKPVAATPKPAPAADSARADRVAAVPKPTGADAADKASYAYNYGYRLWKAGLYPEAEAQLEKFATRFPNHRLVSRAQNVLGLVYLDDDRARDAAQIFYENYSKLPDGDRAPDSLINLARSLTALKRPAADVCQVYKELGDVYGDKLSAAQRAEADKGRAAYKCK